MPPTAPFPVSGGRTKSPPHRVVLNGLCGRSGSFDGNQIAVIGFEQRLPTITREGEFVAVIRVVIMPNCFPVRRRVHGQDVILPLHWRQAASGTRRDEDVTHFRFPRELGQWIRWKSNEAPP